MTTVSICKKMPQRFHVYNIWTIEEALSAKHNPIRGKKIIGLIRDNQIACCVCGIKGTHVVAYRLIREPETTKHVDFFAEVSSSVILITKDHILPVSYGGTNAITNLRPMCASCNGKRGNKINAEELQRILSNLNNHVKSDMGKIKWEKFIKNNNLQIS